MDTSRVDGVKAPQDAEIVTAERLVARVSYHGVQQGTEDYGGNAYDVHLRLRVVF